MRSFAILLVVLVQTGCISTRRHLERASSYEQAGMMKEAHEAYENLYTRRSKIVNAHIGMKRTAQVMLNERTSAATLSYRSKDLETGERARNEAVLLKQRMDRKGLTLQWDGEVDIARNEARRERARALLALADEALRAERFADAEAQATACLGFDPELKDAVYLQRLAQLEPRYRQARKAEELGLWRQAHTEYRWVTDRDATYKDAWQRMSVVRERATYTLAYVPTLNHELYTAQITGLAGQVEQQLAAQFKQAVLDLDDPLIVLVDRDHTEKTLEEQRRAMDGSYDERYAAQAGKMLGAQHVLTGRIVRFDDVLGRKIEVHMQLIDVGTGRIELADVVRVNDQEIERGNTRAQLLDRAAERMARRLAEFDPHAR